MPRDFHCPSCNGMFHDDEIGPTGNCIYCEQGVDSGVGDKTEDGG